MWLSVVLEIAFSKPLPSGGFLIKTKIGKAYLGKTAKGHHFEVSDADGQDFDGSGINRQHNSWPTTTTNWPPKTPWPQHNPLLAELGQTLVHPTTTQPSPTCQPDTLQGASLMSTKSAQPSPSPFPAIWRRLKPAPLSHAGPLPAGGAQWRQVRVKLWFLWKVGTRRAGRW